MQVQVGRGVIVAVLANIWMSGWLRGMNFSCKRCLIASPIRLRGRHGGGAGAPTTIALEDGTAMRGKGKQFVSHGHGVQMGFPGGAGYGPPEQRDRDSVRRDLAYGYITAEQAAEIYGLSETDIKDILNLSAKGTDF